MPERQRAYRGTEVVTVLKGRIGRRGKVEIRNAHGFTETISGRELEALPANDPAARLCYQDRD